MRILLIHNFYQDPGGEDAVFEQEGSLLARMVDVDMLTFKNKKGFKGAIQTLLYPWNFIAGKSVRDAIRKHQPDVIHLHNFHYALGPIVIRIARKAKIPLVMTVHNYRLVCPSATLFHDGELFTDSIGRSFPWKAVWMGVHAHSVGKTFWFAFWNWLHRVTGTWKQVSKYIALTDFAKAILLKSKLGLEDDQILVKQNFVAATPPTAKERKSHFLFVGRLTTEKGIDMLMDTFKNTSHVIKIAGDGPLKDVVHQAAATHNNIRYLGAISKDDVITQLAECSALIFPSIWYEGMPMTIIEAFSQGTPVIASDLGAMKSMIVDGWNGLLFEAGESTNLAEKLEKWTELELEEKNRISTTARTAYQTLYTSEQNKDLLLQIYKQAILA